MLAANTLDHRRVTTFRQPETNQFAIQRAILSEKPIDLGLTMRMPLNLEIDPDMRKGDDDFIERVASLVY